MTHKFPDGQVTDYPCPDCWRRQVRSFLVVKTAHDTGHQFLGCPTWPMCEFTRDVPERMYAEAAGQQALF